MPELITDEEIVQRDLTLNDDNSWFLEQQLKDYPKIMEKYTRMHSQAVKEVDRISMELEVETAKIVNGLCKLYQAKEGKPYPPTGVSEVRRTYVPLVRSWKLKKIELYEATETMNILKGVVDSMYSKGYRIRELFDIIKKRLYGDISGVYADLEE